MVCEWADQIEKLLGQPELCSEMGKKARSRVIAEYDWAVRVEKTIQGYESIQERINR
jgi:glycosyltransferase involved in cell wall biosynthesis